MLGGGNVGINAARAAYGLGAEVVIIDTSHNRLTYIDDIFDGKVVTLMSNSRNIREAAAACDMLVGANTWDGHVTCRPVAEATGRDYRAVEELL
ncbi:MAG: hypothetical protein P1S46_08225 [bacterium]|nr:hypothetical protein [bacterium]MDT8396600.1 hypothetical protein [bacterium]